MVQPPWRAAGQVHRSSAHTYCVDSREGTSTPSGEEAQQEGRQIPPAHTLLVTTDHTGAIRRTQFKAVIPVGIVYVQSQHLEDPDNEHLLKLCHTLVLALYRDVSEGKRGWEMSPARPLPPNDSAH